MQEAEKEMDKAEFEQEVEELTKEQEMPIAELLAKYGIVKGEAADDDDESSSEEEEDGYREDGEEGESGKSKSGAERSGMAQARDKTSWREGASGVIEITDSDDEPSEPPRPAPQRSEPRARPAEVRERGQSVPRSEKAGHGKSKGGKSVSRSKKAGLEFPVGRVHRYLKQGKYTSRIGAGAPVYLAAVLEYLASEILELAGNAARDNKKSRIIPRHLQLAVRNDDELGTLLAGVTIASETSAMLQTKDPDDLIQDCLKLDEPWVYTRLAEGVVSGSSSWDYQWIHKKVAEELEKESSSEDSEANWEDLDVNDGEGELSFKRRVDMLHVADRKTRRERHAARAKEELEELEERNRKERQDLEERKREEERKEREREEGDRKAAVKRKVYADARQSKRKK